jgi:hypothetical protein
MFKFAAGLTLVWMGLMACNFPAECFHPSNLLMCERIQTQAVIGRYDVEWELVNALRRI